MPPEELRDVGRRIKDLSPVAVCPDPSRDAGSDQCQNDHPGEDQPPGPPQHRDGHREDYHTASNSEGIRIYLGNADVYLDPGLYELAPADAFTWASLAWARAIQDRVGDARPAMETSWTLAPYNAPLAMTRLAFAEFLAAAVIAPDAGALTTGEARGIGRDIATIARFKPGLAETILAASPVIAGVHARAPAE